MASEQRTMRVQRAPSNPPEDADTIRMRVAADGVDCRDAIAAEFAEMQRRIADLQRRLPLRKGDIAENCRCAVLEQAEEEAAAAAEEINKNWPGVVARPVHSTDGPENVKALTLGWIDTDDIYRELLSVRTPKHRTKTELITLLQAALDALTGGATVEKIFERRQMISIVNDTSSL